MLIYDEQVRLTTRERDILRRLTGVEPHNVTTRQQLKDWSERYLQSLPDDAREVQLIKAVLRRHLPV
ncbi:MULTISPECIES: hypothetical protein [Marinobacter]|uniref:hypothetical protein n=1 Tax=Marinobacter TaxID=2742 RepID=UPI00117F2CA3|nr:MULTISPECIES: hypothetical protein [Marinobacter]MBD3656496.1 hypothetical protein [Marinobacter sp.]